MICKPWFRFQPNSRNDGDSNWGIGCLKVWYTRFGVLINSISRWYRCDKKTFLRMHASRDEFCRFFGIWIDTCYFFIYGHILKFLFFSYSCRCSSKIEKSKIKYIEYAHIRERLHGPDSYVLVSFRPDSYNTRKILERKPIRHMFFSSSKKPKTKKMLVP